MAIRETSGRLERTLQAIVSSPPRATVTVGSSIVALLFVMEALSQLDPVAYVRFASVYRNFREAKDFEDFVGRLGVDQD